MGGLKKYSDMVLKGSTLVEVIVAMTILLTVFAVGMIIFGNLTRSVTSNRSKQIRLQMQEFAMELQQGEVLSLSNIGDISFFVEEEMLPGLEDFKKVKIYVQRNIDGVVLDSLVQICEQNEER